MFFTLKVMTQSPPVTGVVPEFDPLIVLVRTGLNVRVLKSGLTVRSLQLSAEPLATLGTTVIALDVPTVFTFAVPVMFVVSRIAASATPPPTRTRPPAMAAGTGRPRILRDVRNIVPFDRESLWP